MWKVELAPPEAISRRSNGRQFSPTADVQDAAKALALGAAARTKHSPGKTSPARCGAYYWSDSRAASIVVKRTDVIVIELDRLAYAIVRTPGGNKLVLEPAIAAHSVRVRKDCPTIDIVDELQVV